MTNHGCFSLPHLLLGHLQYFCHQNFKPCYCFTSPNWNLILLPKLSHFGGRYWTVFLGRYNYASEETSWGLATIRETVKLLHYLCCRFPFLSSEFVIQIHASSHSHLHCCSSRALFDLLSSILQVLHASFQTSRQGLSVSLSSTPICFSSLPASVWAGHLA